MENNIYERFIDKNNDEYYINGHHINEYNTNDSDVEDYIINEKINKGKLPFVKYYSYNPDFKTYGDIYLSFKHPIIYKKLFSNSNEEISLDEIVDFIKSAYADLIKSVNINNQHSFQITMLFHKQGVKYCIDVINKLGWRIIDKDVTIMNDVILDIEK